MGGSPPSQPDLGFGCRREPIVSDQNYPSNASGFEGFIAPRTIRRLFLRDEDLNWVDHSQFATIRKLNGFARIRPGFAMLFDIVPACDALCLRACLRYSACELIRNSH